MISRNVARNINDECGKITDEVRADRQVRVKMTCMSTSYDMGRGQANEDIEEWAEELDDVDALKMCAQDAFPNANQDRSSRSGIND